jgi:hypothetical protein
VRPTRLSRHQALLLSLLLLLIAYPILRGPAGSPVLARVLLTAVFLAGGRVVLSDRRLRIFGLTFGVPTLLGVWTGYTLPDRSGPAVAAVLHLTATAFHAFVIAVLLRGVYRERVVSSDVVAAALCGYLLLGVAFGHVHCLVHETAPGSYGGADLGPGGYPTHFRLTYFSFITLTTVGYGDITPVGDAARSLAMVEAVAGQFYLAVLVADLVGKRLAQTLPPAGQVQPPSTPARGIDADETR